MFSENFHMKGINGVGVPILDSARNVVAAISVGSTRDRLDLEHSKKIPALIKSELKLIGMNSV